MDAVDSRARRPCRVTSTTASTRTRRAAQRSRTMPTMMSAMVVVFMGLIALAGAAPIAEEVQEALVVDLVPSSFFGGQVEVFLGRDDARQQVRLLPTLKMDSSTIVQVPTPELCSTLPDPDEWNRFRKPRKGDVVAVNPVMAGSLSMMEVVRWTPRPGEGQDKVGIMLRKGEGDNPANVTLLEGAMPNDGEYIWDASGTFSDLKLAEGADYSLMVFSDSPKPRSSSSGLFSLKTSSIRSPAPVSINVAPTANLSRTDSSIRSQCLNFLLSNGGYYNQTSDPSYRKSDFSQGLLENLSLGREGISSASGYTQLMLDGAGQKNDLKIANVGIDTIISSNLGAGTLALNALQQARGAKSSDSNVVSLFTGTAEHPGSVILGGYDRSLIDTSKSAVFSKGVEHPDIIVLPLGSVVLANDSMNTTATPQKGAFNIALSWESQGLRLPADMLTTLLPYMGNSTYDGSVGGYVFSGTPRTDFTLVFSFNNGTKDMAVSIPMESLMMTETMDDNPVTPLKESGRQYLAVSQTLDGSTAGAYLGRRFLQHVYIVDSPSSVQKFHMNVIPEKIPSEKDIMAASASTLSLFEGRFPDKGSTISNKTGRLVAGLVGGLAAIFVLLIIAWLYHRGTRKRRRSTKNWLKNNDVYGRSDDTVNSLKKELGDRSTFPARMKGVRKETSKGKRSSRRSHKIPTKYDPTEEMLNEVLRKELKLGRGRTRRRKWSPFSSPVDAHSRRKGPKEGGFPLPVEEKRDSILSVMKRRKSEVSTVAREYSSRPASVAVDDPPVAQVAKRNPTLSRAEADLRHFSSHGQMFITDDDGMSVLFESQGLSPPPGQVVGPTIRAVSPTHSHHNQSQVSSAESVPITTGVVDGQDSPGEPKGNHGASKDPERSEESAEPEDVSPISPRISSLPHAGDTPTPHSSERSNIYGPPEEPTIVRPSSAVSGVSTGSAVSRPSRVSSSTRNSVINRIPSIQRTFSRDKRLPRIPSPTMYASPIPSPSGSPILLPQTNHPDDGTDASGSSLVIQCPSTAKTTGDDESIYGLPAVARDGEYLKDTKP